MRIQNCCPGAGVAEVGTVAPTLHLTFRRDQGTVPLREWYTSLSSLALLRDANPGGRGMRAPGWVLTFKLVCAYRPEARLQGHLAPGRETSVSLSRLHPSLALLCAT